MWNPILNTLFIKLESVNCWSSAFVTYVSTFCYSAEDSVHILLSKSFPFVFVSLALNFANFVSMWLRPHWITRRRYVWCLQRSVYLQTECGRSTLWPLQVWLLQPETWWPRWLSGWDFFSSIQYNVKRTWSIPFWLIVKYFFMFHLNRMSMPRLRKRWVMWPADR